MEVFWAQGLLLKAELERMACMQEVWLGRDIKGQAREDLEEWNRGGKASPKVCYNIKQMWATEAHTQQRSFENRVECTSEMPSWGEGRIYASAPVLHWSKDCPRGVTSTSVPVLCIYQNCSWIKLQSRKWEVPGAAKARGIPVSKWPEQKKVDCEDIRWSKQTA